MNCCSRCPRCQQLLPRTFAYFPYAKRSATLRPWCRACDLHAGGRLRSMADSPRFAEAQELVLEDLQTVSPAWLTSDQLADSICDVLPIGWHGIKDCLRQLLKTGKIETYAGRYRIKETS